ncbi:MAG: ImmA/IrrE family metallo-endopeptidase [Rhodobacter sp.]|nr:ImmA/IrrE family metallo-endopeptidase [Rhodobacter sp.]
MEKIKIRVDLPEENRVLYASCVDKEGFVDVNRFIEELPYVEFGKEFMDPRISGILSKLGENEFLITVNQREPEEKQRFTAAHELGHYFLHRNLLKSGGKIEDRYILKAEGVSDEKEEEANQFAAAFLMPLDRVLEAMKSGKNDVNSLAEHFGVSVIAMANRLKLPT